MVDPRFAKGRSSQPSLGSADARGHTVFSSAAPRVAKFRTLTLVGADPALFSECEPAGTFKIRLAKSFAPRQADSSRFSERARLDEPSLPGVERDPFLVSLLAHEEGRLVGSLAVRLDSQARGLAADDLYRDELDPLRAANCRLAELVRVSIDMNAAPRRIVAALFHTAYLYAGVVHGCDYGVIQVPSRHAPLFHDGLGFEYVGDERLNRRVSAATSLLAVHLSAALDTLKTLGGRPDLAAGQASLFPHGFSPEEAEGVVRRLAKLAKSDF